MTMNKRYFLILCDFFIFVSTFLYQNILYPILPPLSYTALFACLLILNLPHRELPTQWATVTIGCHNPQVFEVGQKEQSIIKQRPKRSLRVSLFYVKLSTHLTRIQTDVNNREKNIRQLILSKTELMINSSSTIPHLSSKISNLPMPQTWNQESSLNFFPLYP